MFEIESPIPGVFYRKPAPDKDNFVEEGDHVENGQTIGIIEIMKQFSEVKSGASGTVREFKVPNEGTVNPGDVIAVIDEG
ncbi:MULTISPECIES: acetyl-CoA carboxylase [Corynebacterium]|jgi:acetyl-CoA carboxylase biotin carboxyl carrier protein|uniref:Biotin carboxyl carrier protein of acetyl-CoA carboxylase n=1 Tax=Corynebacterium provencense TaxID=1737425 RepID=A0A2Z3YXX2_9CORY|nr:MULTISPECIES: acetyl-CoA carboxylase [Corynebacterium]AWT27394.1 Biotin carboxyl carrier protein of acetyl-CoA carboxylase [Corynebacterium provencense]MCI1255740.1 acetyl-CoA carboxylase [Corynebacterium provencense]